MLGLTVEAANDVDDKEEKEEELKAANKKELANLPYYYQYINNQIYDNHIERRNMWGNSLTNNTNDINKVFVNYLNNKIKRLPWSMSYDNKLHRETYRILKYLIILCKHNYLTINSQPSINGELQSNGHLLYQKAYVEFFCNYQNLLKIITFCKLNNQKEPKRRFIYDAIRFKKKKKKCF